MNPAPSTMPSTQQKFTKQIVQQPGQMATPLDKVGAYLSLLGRQDKWAAPTAGLPWYFPHTTCISLYSAPGFTILVLVSHQIMSSVVFSTLSTMPAHNRCSINDYNLRECLILCYPRGQLRDRPLTSTQYLLNWKQIYSPLYAVTMWQTLS